MGEQIISKIQDFSFAGKNLKSCPTAYLVDVERDLTPNLKVNEYKIPKRDGSIYFIDSYDDREIRVTIKLEGENRPTLLRNLISSWLTVESFLIFEDEPDKFYKGKIYKPISHKELEYFDEIQISFLVEPFKYQIYGDARDLITAQATMLTSKATMTTNKDSFTSITAPKTGVLVNNGNAVAQPIIRLFGSATVVTIQIMDKACSFANLVNEEVLIDTKKMIVYKIVNNQKVSRLASFSGVFPVINAGNNDILIGGSGLNLDIEVLYRSTYLI